MRTCVLVPRAPSNRANYPPIGPQEFVLGLVYGAGAETDLLEDQLAEGLRRYDYELRTVHLSDHFAAMLGVTDFERERPEAMRRLQDMGDRLRRRTSRDEILAQLAVFLIARARRDDPDDGRRVAWLVRSLKRPEEVTFLRRLYGPRFILLGLHVPEPLRHANVQRRWQRWASVTGNRFEDEATKDIRRDEQDRGDAHGQAVRKTFAQADFFVDGRSRQVLRETMGRTVRLIFGEPFVPPHRDEQAMYHAYAAGLRSAEMGRQVGAALYNERGDLLAVGANEVPAGGGGLYWSPDRDDHRDFAEDPPLDSNTLWQRRVARELLVEMRRTGWLKPSKATTLGDGEFDIDEQRLDQFLGDVDSTRFRAITEFGRAVHAEMDAITTAARYGIAIDGALLACTTFPCHNCTRHLIASGLRRVIYILPYAKSLARDLHDDALVIEPRRPGPVAGRVVFEQFIGVAPRAYPQYFHFGEGDRKDRRGVAMKARTHGDAVPRVWESAGAFSFGGPTFPAKRVSELELTILTDFERLIASTKGLVLPPAAEEPIS
jgi:deoxycytidylate deaminase